MLALRLQGALSVPASRNSHVENSHPAIPVTIGATRRIMVFDASRQQTSHPAMERASSMEASDAVGRFQWERNDVPILRRKGEREREARLIKSQSNNNRRKPITIDGGDTMGTALTMAVLAGYVLRTDSGEMDIDGTCEQFRSDLLNYQVERETEAATIGAAVNDVFDTHSGARINMPALQSLALQRLNVQPENFKALQTRVAEYVRENASPERSDGRLFKIGKGKGGGVSRWSDQPLSASELEALGSGESEESETE